MAVEPGVAVEPGWRSGRDILYRHQAVNSFFGEDADRGARTVACTMHFDRSKAAQTEQMVPQSAVTGRLREDSSTISCDSCPECIEMTCHIRHKEESPFPLNWGA